jgi:hypothetical protein
MVKRNTMIQRTVLLPFIDRIRPQGMYMFKELVRHTVCCKLDQKQLFETKENMIFLFLKGLPEIKIQRFI